MAMPQDLPIATPVRYRPGQGTYGYEDALEAGGCLSGVVIGHTATRVRVRVTFRVGPRTGQTYERAVDRRSLQHGDA